MNKRTVILVILASLAAGLSLPAQAQDGGEVIIGQQLVLRIRYPAGSYSIKERADLVTERINEVLGSAAFNPSDVKVAMQNKEYVVLIDGKLLITADKKTADFNGSTTEQLANIWADNLRRVIPEAKALVNRHLSSMMKF